MPRPPSTSRAAPVIRLASSLAKNAAALPISAGNANRPRGIVFIIPTRASGESGPPRKKGTLPMLVKESKRERGIKVSHIRFAGHGVDDIEPNVMLRPLNGKSLCSVGDTTLAGTVPNQRRSWSRGRHAGDVDEQTANMLSQEVGDDDL